MGSFLVFIFPVPERLGHSRISPVDWFAFHNSEDINNAYTFQVNLSWIWYAISLNLTPKMNQSLFSFKIC